MPRISVVIPTLGGDRPLARVLAALAAQEDVARDDLEAIVVAKADAPDEAPSPVGTLPVRRLRRKAPDAGAARETGWRAADAQLILFLDDDVVPSPRLVAEHLEWHGRHPEPEAGVLGRVRWAPELRVTPFMRWLERGIQFDFDSIEGDEAGWGRFYTANASVKRSLLERAGGFDPRFPFHYEDLALGRRMAAHDLRLLYNRAAVGDHLHAVTPTGYARRMADVAAAERRFCAIHPDVEPYFFRMLSAAAARPRARGWSARLAGLVPERVPWLGPRVWASFDTYHRQRLADAFLPAWEAAAGEDAAGAGAGGGTAAGDRYPAGSGSSERASSGGSDPGGPK
jgi:GT2 family glycosyltransferase